MVSPTFEDDGGSGGGGWFAGSGGGRRDRIVAADAVELEKTSSHVLHFPGEEEGEPSQAGETGCASTEDGVALRRVGFVAVCSEDASAGV